MNREDLLVPEERDDAIVALDGADDQLREGVVVVARRHLDQAHVGHVEPRQEKDHGGHRVPREPTAQARLPAFPARTLGRGGGWTIVSRAHRRDATAAAARSHLLRFGADATHPRPGLGFGAGRARAGWTPHPEAAEERGKDGDQDPRCEISPHDDTLRSCARRRHALGSLAHAA